MALTSLIAGTATTLYGIWHFQRASPLALGANLAAMPLVSLVVMPSALLAVLAMPFNLDWTPLDLMDQGISAVVAVARWFSERTPIDATGLIPLSATLVLTIALVLLTLTTTRLRLLSLPFLLCGALLMAKRDLPYLLVSEDARLIAMPTSDGRLAVNRSRPNGFTSENWLRAMHAQAMVKPLSVSDGALLEYASPPNEEGFRCGENACVVRPTSGAVVAHAKEAQAKEGRLDRDSVRHLCRTVDMLIINDATMANPRTANEAPVITSRDLARRGNAAIYLDHSADAEHAAHIVFAIREPWHAHRQYSRSARGLDPYRKRERD